MRHIFITSVVFFFACAAPAPVTEEPETMALQLTVHLDGSAVTLTLGDVGATTFKGKPTVRLSDWDSRLE